MGLKPDFQIIANHQDVTEIIKQRLSRLSVTDETGVKSDKVTLELMDSPPVEIPDSGASIAVSLGYENALQSMGVFTLGAIKIGSGQQGDYLHLEASAQALTDAYSGESAWQTHRDRVWGKAVTLGDIVKTLASEHGITPVIQAALANKPLNNTLQTQESDMHFLTRITQGFDAIAKPTHGKLLVTPKGLGENVNGQALPEASLSMNDVTRWAVNIETRNPAKKVTARYIDIQAGETQSVSVGEGEPCYQIKALKPSKALAEEAIRAHYRRAQRLGNELNLTLPGNPRLFAESRLNLIDFRPGIIVRWVIQRVIHTMDKKGYTTQISATPLEI